MEDRGPTGLTQAEWNEEDGIPRMCTYDQPEKWAASPPDPLLCHLRFLYTSQSHNEALSLRLQHKIHRTRYPTQEWVKIHRTMILSHSHVLERTLEIDLAEREQCNTSLGLGHTCW